MSPKGPTVPLYLAVFAALLVLLGMTWWVATLHLGAWAVPAALAIAVIKTMLVALYFMHVRWSERMVPVMMVSSVLFLALLMGMTLAEFFTRG